jgi:MoaA/NifB/PqqE/SkfB family radical SAM enzyme
MRSPRWYLAEAGVRLRGVSLMFDLTNACSFRCPSCPVGNSPKRKPATMTLELFSKILDRVQSQTRIRYVLLYSSSEPGLHPRLAEFVAELNRRKVGRVMISTNLSHVDRIIQAMKAGVDEIRISFSGFDNGEYFHTGRNMRQFIQSCHSLSAVAKFYPKTRIGLIWHRYKTNLHEEGKVRDFAIAHGFRLIRETAFFIPFEKITGDVPYSPEDRKLISHLIMSPAEKLDRTERDPLCYYQQKQIVIDATGQVYLCRHVYDKRFVVGDILRDSLRDIRRAMDGHSYCVKCKECGLNKYTEPT